MPIPLLFRLSFAKKQSTLIQVVYLACMNLIGAPKEGVNVKLISVEALFTLTSMEV